ncbi:PD-(D/E)XK nuclease family protein [Thiospirochaeta perfilievii]|uniref:PD-(D/E)XK nuclease family protein n=1 Tax=Thiospirochaeta perfilievii TaxID=252967 RepID=A0A5C1Q7E0_9SPIO|nr:PD-(D/E)XK nuclease family protein [Thiospirochaeta perfilievii]QEN03297.1 PD-(D/E)XK nuclease family protein [Thiospirochaeta perfilievii]
MIKRKYVISSSILMSRRYASNCKGVGFTPVTFRQLVMELYNNPLFLFDSEVVVDSDFYQSDIKIYNSIGLNNYFFDSRDYLGSRKLIGNALHEIRLSCSCVDSLELPIKSKSDSLKDIYNSFYTGFFDYSMAVKKVISRIESGEYDSFFGSIELVVLDRPELLGIENILFDLLVDRVDSNVHSSMVNLNFCHTTCKSSITKSGNINHLFVWMMENKLKTNNTIVVALDYDSTAAEFYNMIDRIPIYFTRGFKCTALSLFEPLMTGISHTRSKVKDDTTFLDRVEWRLRNELKESVEVKKIFYEKVLAIVIKIKKSLCNYIENGIKIDILGELLSEIEGIYLTQEELGLEKKGLHITTLEDVYTLEFDNVAVMGLVHGNYPKKVKLDPILKEDEREAINQTTNGEINLIDNKNNQMLEKLLSSVRNNTFLSYISHQEGKLTVPSIFFNHILAENKKPIEVEEIYKLCGVKEGYLSDLLDQKDYLDIRSIGTQNDKIISYKKSLYSREEIESDYGLFETLNRELSATSLTTFFECPYKFNLQYNNKIYFPDLGMTDLTQWLDSSLRGQFIHKIYEDFINLFILEDENDYGAFLQKFNNEDKFNTQFEKSSKAFIQENKLDNDVPEYIKRKELEEIKEIFSKYIDNELNIIDDFYPIKAESKFISDWNIDCEIITLKGVIDRIDTDGNGNYRIWDFKTGGNPFDFKKGYLFCIDTPYGPKINLQHALYLKALKDMDEFSDILSVEAGYYYTSDRGNWAKVTYQGPDPIEKQIEILKTYVYECNGGRYYKNPKSCKFCDYKSICSNNQKKREGILEDRINTLISVLGEENV